MQTHYTTRGRPWVAAFLAGAAVLGCPGVSHAHSDEDLVPFLAVVGHASLLPAYVSIIYYAAASEKEMALGWAVPNIVLSVAVGSLGVVSTASLAQQGSDHEGAYLAAGSLVAGPVVAMTATILQRSRSPERPSALVFLPTIGAPGSHGSGVGAVIAGTF